MPDKTDSEIRAAIEGVASNVRIGSVPRNRMLKLCEAARQLLTQRDEARRLIDLDTKELMKVADERDTAIRRAEKAVAGCANNARAEVQKLRARVAELEGENAEMAKALLQAGITHVVTRRAALDGEVS